MAISIPTSANMYYIVPKFLVLKVWIQNLQTAENFVLKQLKPLDLLF